MDWRQLKFDWNRARAFLVTAEEGSFSAAARALGMAQPTLGRQVDALEEELGVVLFERTGRNLLLTPSGLELLTHVRAMGEAAGHVSLTATGQSDQLEGRISLTASEIESAFLLPPVLAKLRRFAPGVCVDVIASNSTQDLQRREADIAIRNYRPDQSELITKKIREDVARLYGAKELVKRFGDAQSLDEMRRSDYIGLAEPDTYLEGLGRMGLSVTEDQLKVTSNSHFGHWHMIKAGMGIGIVPQDLGDADSGLVRILDGVISPVTYPMWLTSHRELQSSRRMRLVFDFLAEELRTATRVPSGNT